MHLKKYICLLLTTLLFTTISAQVTIGSSIKPNSGALLDLKENDEPGVNSTKGLLMPRVALEKKAELNPIIEGTATDVQKLEHTGVILFNTSTIDSELLCPGLYVWNATEWSRLYDECVDNRTDLAMPITGAAADVDGYDANSTKSIIELSYTSSKPITLINTSSWYTVKDNPTKKVIEIDAAPNNGVYRTQPFTVSDGITDIDVDMKQEDLDWQIVKSPTTKIPATGGKVDVEIVTNSQHRKLVTSNLANLAWVTINNDDTYTPSVTLAANDQTIDRTATLNVELKPLTEASGKKNLGTSKNDSFDVVQAALSLPDLAIIGSKAKTLDMDGYEGANGIVTFAYTSSRPVTVTKPDAENWYAIDHDATAKEIYVDAAPTSLSGSRTGTITITDGTKVEKVTITQSAMIKHTTTASPSSVSANGGTTTITIDTKGSRREPYTNSGVDYGEVISAPSSNPVAVKVLVNTGASRKAGFKTVLGDLPASSGKTNRTPIPADDNYIYTYIQQSGGGTGPVDPDPEVPTNGIWLYKDNRTGGEFETIARIHVNRSPIPVYNITIKIDQLYGTDQFPLMVAQDMGNKGLELKGGVTTSGYNIVNDPVTGRGQYITFTSVAPGPTDKYGNNGYFQVWFKSKNGKYYVFGYSFGPNGQ